MKVVCRKCLIADLDFDEELQGILDYIKKIPEEKKVDSTEYQRRLSICKECNDLVNGMCAKCGCFVELRAIKPKMYCASEKKLW